MILANYRLIAKLIYFFPAISCACFTISEFVKILYEISSVVRPNDMQRRKLFYVPGLISLIGLPILLLLFGPEEEVRQTVVRLFIPYEDPKDEEAAKFSKAMVYETIKGKNIISIHGQTYLDDEFDSFRYNRKMSFIGSELERLQFT